MKKPINLVCAAIAAVFVSTVAYAEDYVFGDPAATSQSSSRLAWGDTDNWTPAAVPGVDDSVNWYPTKTGSHRIAYMTLDGDYEVGYITSKWRSLDIAKDDAVVAPVTFTVRHFLGSDGYSRHVVQNGARLLIPASCCYKTGRSDDEISSLTLNSGSAVLIYGSVESHTHEYRVNAGSTLTFSPVSYELINQSKEGHAEKFIIGGGTVEFPRGLDVAADSTSATRNNTQSFTHSAGTLTFGGDFVSVLPWDYTWSGGTLNIVSNATFGANIALTVPASANVAVDVAAGKTFTATGFSADSTATITKTGGGILALAPTAASVAVNAGGIGLATASAYDLSNVTFAGGTTLALTALGATVNSYDSSLTANATFTADLSGAAAGTVVLNSSDPALLAKAQSELAGSVSEGFGLAISGTALSVEVQSSYGFGGVGSILDPECWGGSLPPAGADVAITGAATVATLSSGSFPAWNSIEVKDGAFLRIETDATLLPISLNKSATLVVANNAVATLSSAGDLSGIATAQQIPGLSVTAGATLNVPGGMKFSNVSIVLEGTIAATTEGGIVFGYAAPGETTYIGLVANGGTIDVGPASTSDYDVSPLEFCCPASDGTVVAIDEMVLTGVSILPVYVSSGVTYTFTESYKYGFHLGVNNPTSSLFKVVFDGTQWGVSGKTIIRGGGTFRLANGGTYKNYETHSLWNRTAEISEMGCVVVGTGCEFRLAAMGDYGNKALEINPGYAGHRAVVVDEGGIFETFRSSGNGKGVFSASNGVFQVYLPWTTNAAQEVVAYNEPFTGLSAVEIADGSTLTFSTRNRVFWNPGQFHNDSGDRVVALADVPITGEDASIVLSNANANVFGVIVRSGANTATGSAGVVAPASGIGATTLYFANGANWAGTVTAGGFVVTNLVNAAAPCTNSFGTIDLAENYPLRVWKEAGAIVANDSLNVVGYDGVGRLVPTSDAAFARGDRVVVGKIAKNGNLPRAGRGWVAEAKPIDGDDDNDMLVLTYGRGLQVILR